MSIQRYKAINGYGGDSDLAKDDRGEIVLFADHLEDVRQQLFHLLSTLADIRAALGVGEKPMLGELAGIVRTRMGVIKILERESKENAAEVERLTAERDALSQKLKMTEEELDEVQGKLDDSEDFLSESLAIILRHVGEPELEDGDFVSITDLEQAVMLHNKASDAAVRERDAAKKALPMWERPHDDKDLLAMQEQAKGGGLAAMQAYINALKWHLKQKSMERDAAVEALRRLCDRVVQREGRQIQGLLYDTRNSEGRCVSCGTQGEHADANSQLPCILGMVERCRAALAKIGGDKS